MPTLRRQKGRATLERGRLTFGKLHFPFEGTPSSPIGSQRLYGFRWCAFVTGGNPHRPRQKRAYGLLSVSTVVEESRRAPVTASNGVQAKSLNVETWSSKPCRPVKRYEGARVVASAGIAALLSDREKSATFVLAQVAISLVGLPHSKRRGYGTRVADDGMGQIVPMR